VDRLLVGKEYVMKRIAMIFLVPLVAVADLDALLRF